jgi:hypothetical protein
MEKVYLPINFVNTISVLLMFFLGMTLLGFVISGLQSFQTAQE